MLVVNAMLITFGERERERKNSLLSTKCDKYEALSED